MDAKGNENAKIRKDEKSSMKTQHQKKKRRRNKSTILAVKKHSHDDCEWIGKIFLGRFQIESTPPPFVFIR